MLVYLYRVKTGRILIAVFQVAIIFGSESVFFVQNKNWLLKHFGL